MTGMLARRELGGTFLDTAQLYGPLTNESLLGEAIQGHRDEYVIATKFARRTDDATPGENLHANKRIADKVAEIAQEKGVPRPA